MQKTIYSMLLMALAASAAAHETNTTPAAPTDSLEQWDELDEVVITRKLASTRKLRSSGLNTEIMTGAELHRAACCNLGESFTTNPSVDVNYSDAATGAKQIKLLGLPGTYVQMLTENVPNLRGAGAQFGLSYIPGPWMQSIQVSKGASSVKNGYESVTGQINIETLKSTGGERDLQLNAYVDHEARVEANAAGILPINDKLSTALLLHGENSFTSHDGNDDGFADKPKVRQFAALNRWAYMTHDYAFQGVVKYLDEKRESGQIGHHAPANPYLVDITTRRGELWLKNAYTFDHESNSNIALILSGSIHDQDGAYGLKRYDVLQHNLYASLMFEREFGPYHSLSAGLSFNGDWYRQHYRLMHDASLPLTPLNQSENTPGVYAQYTFNYDSRLVLMGGLRYDHSSRFGSMVTPRLHARWNVADALSIHASAGKGYRSPFALVDNSYLLASSRELIIRDNLTQEEAWNYGAGLSGTVHLWGNPLTYSAEYYYTNFRHQTVADLDFSPTQAIITDLKGRSYSHAAQVELSYVPFKDFTFTAAYRYNDVRVDYGRGWVEKPLTSRSKGLFTINYAPMMGLWQFDGTLAITGGGRLPNPGEQALWNDRYKTFPTLNLQVTRNFRHWAVYIGGENLTGYRQKNPIIGATDPWGPTFDSTMVYAPVHGPMVYAGFRYTLK